jgi:hypothetical protein
MQPDHNMCQSLYQLSVSVYSYLRGRSKDEKVQEDDEDIREKMAHGLVQHPGSARAGARARE